MFAKKKRIDELDFRLSREDLLQRSRILIVDDEKPELIEDLINGGFAIEYRSDIKSAEIGLVDKPRYDLIILDFLGVGNAFGPDEGLSLLRHIKRVNPSTIVFAYTSKSLGPEHADFYRSTDGVLRKDAGIAESLEKIEEGLRRARSVQNLWSTLLSVTGTTPGSKEDLGLQDLYVRGLSKQRKLEALKQKILQIVGGDQGKQTALLIVEKLIEIGIRAALA